jgi:signal transduction histidine kinase
VLLQVQSLKESPALSPRQEQGLAAIERNVLRLAVLVKDLLSASTLNLGQLELSPAQLDLQELAMDAARSFQEQARQAGVALEARPAGGVPAFADRDRVMQVLVNLLGNALKFTPRGGSVVVEAAERDGAAAVTVTDTGLGFAASERGRLFRPFGRLHEEVPGAPRGTGLGLFISKGIVEESGGRIWAESHGPGTGCTVGFTLPRAAPARPGRGIQAARGFSAAPEPVQVVDAARPDGPPR